MTTNVTRTIINEGPTKLIVQLLIESDGTDGELTNYVILDPLLDLNPPATATPPSIVPDIQMTIQQAWYSFSAFDLLVRFNALNPMTGWIWIRSPGDSYTDFRYFAGVKDRTTTDHDGKIMISTQGLTDNPNSTGMLIIELKKD